MGRRDDPERAGRRFRSLEGANEYALAARLNRATLMLLLLSRVLAGLGAAVPNATIPHLRYLTYYTVGPMNLTDWWGEAYTLPGPTGAEPGVNLAIGFGESSQEHPHRGRVGMSSFPNIERVWAQHRVPSFYTPDNWFHCHNATHPGGLLDSWQSALAHQAIALRPMIATGMVAGIFYGDELSCCGVPFWAVDAGISFFRGALGEDHAVVHHVNACQMTLGCPPPPNRVCRNCPRGCGNSSSVWLPRYWPRVPAALDFVSVDVYCWPDVGACEVALAQAFYNEFVFPKLSPHQKVWLVPGLFATIRPANSSAESIALSVNDSSQLEKMQAYADWTRSDSRIVGWMPYHYYNRIWSPTPASGSWGAESMPRTLDFIRQHAPLPLPHDTGSLAFFD